ncbi:type 4a pilus minor pilin PilE [soil metagenome]
MKLNSEITGFTLVELLFTIAIIAILCGIAIPSYNHYVHKAKRMDAKTALLDLSARLERYYTQYQTYASATLASGQKTTDILDSAVTPEGLYKLSITHQEATRFTIKATPIEGKSQAKDTTCDSFILDSLGQKSITGEGDVTDCW